MARRRRKARSTAVEAPAAWQSLAGGLAGLDACKTLPATLPAASAPPVAFPAVPTRAQIERLEAEMRQFEQTHIEPVHHFADGLYAREITIPAGMLLTGKVHRTEHLNIVSKGRITVWTEDGMRTVEAPCTLVSRPGTKRVGLAHTDTVWTTIHANAGDERDLDKLEERLIEAPALADAREGDGAARVAHAPVDGVL